MDADFRNYHFSHGVRCDPENDIASAATESACACRNGRLTLPAQQPSLCTSVYLPVDVASAAEEHAHVGQRLTLPARKNITPTSKCKRLASAANQHTQPTLDLNSEAWSLSQVAATNTLHGRRHRVTHPASRLCRMTDWCKIRMILACNVFI